jgi:predicted nuclease with TOPRIM domain
LFDVRSRADYLKSVYACTKDQLSPQAFSDLAERWNELTETALVIDASLAAGTEQEYVEMKTSPLDTAKYVGKEDKKVVDWHHGEIVPGYN